MSEKLPPLPYVCVRCGVQQFEPYTCANCGRDSIVINPDYLKEPGELDASNSQA